MFKVCIKIVKTTLFVLPILWLLILRTCDQISDPHMIDFPELWEQFEFGILLLSLYNMFGCNYLVFRKKCSFRFSLIKIVVLCESIHSTWFGHWILQQCTTTDLYFQYALSLSLSKCFWHGEYYLIWKWNYNTDATNFNSTVFSFKW